MVDECQRNTGKEIRKKIIKNKLAHPRGKTQVGVVGGGVEAVGGKVVIAAQTTDKRSRSGVEG